MNPLFSVPLALFSFTILWNLIWGRTPSGTPWSVYLRRVFRLAVVVAFVAFGCLALWGQP